MSETELRARALREAIANHEHRAYVLEAPEISDAQESRLRTELDQLEAQQSTVPLDSPGRRRPSPPREMFVRAMHMPPWEDVPELRSPMALRAFYERLTAAHDGRDPVLVGTGWMTGAEVALTYSDGILRSAVLRGDGLEGEDVTDNVRTIPSVPLRLRPPGSFTVSRDDRPSGRAPRPSTLNPVPPFPDELVVQGVLTMRDLDLVALDRQRADSAVPPYVDASAAAVASVRALDPAVTASRPLCFFAFSAAPVLNGVDSYWQLIGVLKSWGFRVSPAHWRCEGIEEVVDFVSALGREKTSFAYPLSGGVLTLDPLQEVPEGVFGTVRLKFISYGKQARVKSVYRAVGRGGAVLPLALLEAMDDGDVPDVAPIPAVDGASILDVEAGAVLRVLTGGGTPLLQPPSDEAEPRAAPLERCPSCDGPLRHPADEPAAYCDNLNCKGRVRSRWLHLMGPRGVASTQLPRRVVESLSQGAGPQLLDVYQLDPAALEGLDPETAASFAEDIAGARRLPLWRLLYLSDIPGLGERSARAIAARVRDLDGFAAFVRGEDAPVVPGADPASVVSVRAWGAGPGMGRIEALLELGVEILDDASVFSAPLSGRRVAVEGKLTKLTSELVQDEIERRGGTVDMNFSRCCDILITGEVSHEIRALAREAGIPAVTEDEFIDFLHRVDGGEG